MDVTVQWIVRSDMREIMEIERESHLVPWTRDEFLRCFKRRNVIGLVAMRDEVEGDRIAGYVIYELGKRSLRLLNLAVRRECQLRGVGRTLVNRLTERLERNGRERLVAEVWERNVGAQLFFRALGFRATGVLRGFFRDGEDAYEMEWLIKEAVC